MKFFVSLLALFAVFGCEVFAPDSDDDWWSEISHSTS